MPVENRPIPHKSAFKGLLWDYDAVLGASDEECCYSLSDKDVQLILATIDPMSWLTRWMSPTETLIDIDNLLKWQGNLARKLMSGCCNDQVVLHRVTTDGEMEISTDDGVTWVPDPNDPRVTATQLANTIPGSGTEKKCNAANNALGNIQDAQASFAASLTSATTILGLALEIATAIAILFFTVGTTAEALIPLIISAAIALFGVLETDYNAEFTTTVWNQLVCDMYCTVGSNGQWNTSQFNDLLALLDTDFTGNVALTFHAILTGWGTVGLNNAAIVGDATESDCSDCDCPLTCGDPAGFTVGTVISTGVNELGQPYVEIQTEDTGAGDFQYIEWGDFATLTIPPNICCRVVSLGEDIGLITAKEYYDCEGGYHAATPEDHNCQAFHLFTASSGTSATIIVTFTGAF